MTPLQPLAHVAEVAAPITFEVITGNRYIRVVDGPIPWGEIKSYRERSIFLIDDRTGLVSAETEYGSYAYHWPPAHRGEDIFTFLASLQFDYFMGKAAKQLYREIDLDRTIRDYRLQLVQTRRDRELSKEAARACWAALESLLHEVDRRLPDDFVHAWYRSNALCRWIDACDVGPWLADTHQARHFWDVIWATLISSDAFRRRMVAKEAAA